MSAATLSGVLSDVANAPHISDTDALRIYVIVHRVKGVKSGAYLYQPKDRTLAAR